MCRTALLILALSLCLGAQVAPRDRMIIVVSLDGLPAYALEDPKLPMPTLRRLMREGASATRMTTTNPAFTWPSHTSMMTGLWPARHGVLYNGLPVRHGADAKEPVVIEPRSPKTELVQATTVYDLAHQAGLKIGHADWVAIENAPTVDWAFQEWPSLTGEIEKEMIAAGEVTPKDIEEFTKSNMTFRDRIWTAAAVRMIRTRKPNLLLFHPLDVDVTHHKYGARTAASEVAVAFADDRLKEIVDAVNASGMRERTTIFVVSDHGFKSTAKNIRPNAALRAAGICCAYTVPEGGSAQVYITDPSRRAGLLPELKKLLSSIEGVAAVIDRDSYAALGLPDPLKNPRMGDLVLTARDGYAFGGAAEGAVVVDNAPGSYIGYHGYPNSDPDMDAILVAWGYGIRPGVRLDRIRVVDIAPTLAKLLGLEMGNVDGRVLTEILK
jgi:predicted AlkP superfamily pyrophosphatase or phosphodiesterase